MYSYVFIQDKFGNRNWYLIIDEVNEISIEKAFSLWVENSTREVLNGRRGLTLEFILDNGALYKCKMIESINCGYILLVNKYGGYQILTDEHTILKRVTQKYFPTINEEFLNGILKSNGDFLKCEYGHHYEIVQELSDEDENCIVISHDDLGKNSSIFIEGKITKAQKKFLIENVVKLDYKHIEQLKAQSILT